ncbi:acyl-CoA dehydrogenase family protein [Mycobacterium hubeiense]|uniref:acyl-CoA dehydrogenase family protein n=1 Tax=Mycobacterium hubeiense TaxID=1867256 RepID=UPI000C7F5D3C|nr:acyl-CoA dehydrogenase family protein [Mycobacterium sp. QGD 101]
MTQGSSQAVREAVEALLPAIADAAADVDRNGAVDPQVIVGLHDAGYFSLLQPKSFGGLEADPNDFLALTLEISSACTSTGWLAGWLGVNSWGLTLRDERAQQEIWGTDRRTLLCSSYAPAGRLERVDGGFRLSGRWKRATGARQASWLNTATLLVGPDGAAQDFVAVLVPRTDYEVEPNWNGLGLRGIGADDVVATDALVPDYRTFSWLNIDQSATVAPLYRLPQPTLYTLAGTIPLLGAARRVLRARRPDTTAAQSALAMAETDIELSLRQIRRNVANLMQCARAGGYPDTELVLRSRRDQVMASERAMRAVRTVMQESGADDDGLLERVWRDVQTARVHVASNVTQVLSVVGRFAFGLKVDDLIW